MLLNPICTLYVNEYSTILPGIFTFFVSDSTILLYLLKLVLHWTSKSNFQYQWTQMTIGFVESFWPLSLCVL